MTSKPTSALLTLLRVRGSASTNCTTLVCHLAKREQAHCRDGQKSSGPGILGLSSSSALILNDNPMNPMITTDMIAVLAFQFAGCPYQPPAGDQTCFG